MKTTFLIRTDQFCFDRIPFGIAAAPTIFQKLMNRMIWDMYRTEAVIYLEDIIIYSRNFKDHVCSLSRVLGKIKEADLRINPEKCSILKKKYSF